MAEGRSRHARAAAGLALMCGGVALVAHPGATAPAARTGRTAVRKPALKGQNPAHLPPPIPAVPDTPPVDAPIMKVSEVKPGMKGYGYTVFHGTQIERFGVDIIGVMEKANMGEPLVLVKLSGGPITQRAAFLIQGMSGSPIYVNGKLLGAFSMGEAWPKEPLGMVTPIEDMMEALDPKLSEIPAGETAFDLDAPAAKVADADAAGNSLLRTAALPNVTASGQSFRPLGLPISVSGLSGRNLERMSQILQPFNMTVLQGPGSSSKSFKADLTPGAAIGVALMTGDVDMTGIGTVTYRKGDQLLAFGHPMMQLGAAQFPVCTAWIHDVFSGFQVSHKIGAAGEMVGTLTQDRPFSIAAKVGAIPKMVPVTYNVTDKGTGRARTFHIQTANHPLLVGQLIPIAVDQGLYTVRPVPGDAIAHVKMKVETEGAGTITRENTFFDPSMIDVAAVRELQELMGILSNNSFRRVPVKSVTMDVTFEDKRPTATVDRVFLAQDKYEPGDEVNVGVVLRPYRKEPVVTYTKVKIPESASNGRAVLMVQGGGTRVNLAPLLSSGGPGALPLMTPPPDASLRQVIKRFETREHNNQVVARLIFPTTAVNVKGERLAQLPSALVDVMRSSKTTGFRLERDEVKSLKDTDYLVDGIQTLQVEIERKDQLEKPKSGISRPAGPTMPPSFPGAPTTGRTAVSTDPDLEDESTLRFTVDGQPRVLRLTTPEDEEKPAPKEKGKKGSRKKGSPDKKAETAGPAAEGKKPEAPAPMPMLAKPAVTAAATAAPDDKLVGKAAVRWTQTSQSDFERGTFTGTAAATNGEVRLAPSLKLLHESGEQFVWSVAAGGGNVYAGTGNSGQVLKIEPSGKTSVLLSTGELEVHALARDKDGNLYAGTSPNGKILKITPDGKSTELLAMNGAESASDAGGKFVLALLPAEDGTLYAGTGPTGQIYRVAPGASKAELLCRLPARSVMSLALGVDGALYAGTAEDGAVYQLPAGEKKAKVLYDTDQTAVTGLAVDGEGYVYAACAPSGQVYKIQRDGAGQQYAASAKGALFGLQIDHNGNLYTCSGNSVLRIDTDGAMTILSDKKIGQLTCLAWDETGHLLAGAANIGSIYRLAPSTSGVFESTVHDAKLPAHWGRILFTGVLPKDGVLKVETRSGNAAEPDDTWSPWAKPEEKEGNLYVASPSARFLQYRVLMQAEKGIPALRDLTVTYVARNRAPKLTLAVPVGGEVWKGTQTLKWSAVDPDSDTLTYEITYSADGGKTWKPVGQPGSAASPESAKATQVNAKAALDQYKRQLDADPKLTPGEREADYDRAKTQLEGYLHTRVTDAAAKTESKTEEAKPAAPGKPANVTRTATFNWDTKQVPDGIYLLRVAASDKAANPSDSLADTKTTEPFIVANTPPRVIVSDKGVTVDASRSATVSGMAMGRVPLKGAQYRVGEGDWLAVDANDGIWDSAVEAFHFTAALPAAGEQTIEIKLVDTAGNAAVQKVKAMAAKGE